MINEEIQNEVTYSYDFDRIENLVEMRWIGDIIGTRYMFCQYSYITEIDLSNFYTSEVNDMEGMFALCSSLTSLDLSNFDTSKVMNMYTMFYNCESLTSVQILILLKLQICATCFIIVHH